MFFKGKRNMMQKTWLKKNLKQLFIVFQGLVFEILLFCQSKYFFLLHPIPRFVFETKAMRNCSKGTRSSSAYGKTLWFRINDCSIKKKSFLD